MIRSPIVAESIKAVVNGKAIALSRGEIVRAMRGVAPEAIRSHCVSVGDVQYPVKQVFAAATGLDRLDFTSAVARRHLMRLGFDVERAG
jgi:hypothetical protein